LGRFLLVFSCYCELSAMGDNQGNLIFVSKQSGNIA
jgi:hypothetical protein